MGSSGVRVLVWTASGMEHWKKLIKISSDTDCYYCINNMTYSIHVYHRSIILVTIPDILFIIMSHVYLVTLSDTCYTSCGDILFMCAYDVHSTYYVSCILCRHCYCITVVWLCRVHKSIYSYLTRHLYATVIIGLHKNYKVSKTCYILFIHWCNHEHLILYHNTHIKNKL